MRPVPALLLATVVSVPLVGEEVTAPAAGDGETLIVTAERLEQPQRRSTAATTVLDEDQRRHGDRQTTWVDALRRVPGADVIATNGGIDGGGLIGLRLRATQGNADTPVLLDGIPVNDPGTVSGEPFLGALPAAAFERIEVVRGPQSGLYGSRAVGGVINLISLRPTAQPQARLQGEGGSFGTAAASASVSGPLGDARDADGRPRLGYAAGIDGLRSDGFSVLTDRLDGDPDGHEADGVARGGANARVEWRPSDVLMLYGAGAGGLARHEYDAFDQPDDAVSERRQRRWRAAAGGEADLTTELGVAVDAALTRLERTEHGPLGDERYDAQEHFAAARLIAQALPSLRLLLGADALRQQADTTSVSDRFQSNVGTYAEALWSPDPFELSAVVRHDFHSNAGDADTGRLGAAWFLWDRLLTLRASVASAFRAASLDEQYGVYADPFLVFSPNPDLEPQRSVGWEAGVTVAPVESVTVTSTWFDTRYRNRITSVFDFSTTPATGTLVNEDSRAHAHGLENEVAWDDHRLPVAFRATYTWQRTSDENGAEFIGVPEDKGALEATARAPLGWATLGVDLAGSRRSFDDRRIDGYVTMSAIVGWHVTRAIDAYVRGENLADAAITDNSNDSFGATYAYTGMPRALFAGVVARF
ncbi:MAG: TonB-dependent receptor [Planctomycetes bacterium]|nr:TonB-dependent receptor [Planctomycetota bacterium]